MRVSCASTATLLSLKVTKDRPANDNFLCFFLSLKEEITERKTCGLSRESVSRAVQTADTSGLPDPRDQLVWLWMKPQRASLREAREPGKRLDLLPLAVIRPQNPYDFLGTVSASKGSQLGWASQTKSHFGPEKQPRQPLPKLQTVDRPNRSEQKQQIGGSLSRFGSPTKGYYRIEPYDCSPHTITTVDSPDKKLYPLSIGSSSSIKKPRLDFRNKTMQNFSPYLSKPRSNSNTDKRHQQLDYKEALPVRKNIR